MFRIGKYFVMFRAQPNRITKDVLSTTHVLPVPKYNHIEGVWILINTFIFDDSRDGKADMSNDPSLIFSSHFQHMT